MEIKQFEKITQSMAQSKMEDSLDVLFYIITGMNEKNNLDLLIINPGGWIRVLQKIDFITLSTMTIVLLKF